MMSIDAIINKVTKDGNNLVLDLMSREVDGLRGQSQLTILNFTHTPIAGQEIWGGSDSCIIEPGCGEKSQKYYRRVMYTQLEENFADEDNLQCPQCKSHNVYHSVSDDLEAICLDCGKVFDINEAEMEQEESDGDQP